MDLQWGQIRKSWGASSTNRWSQRRKRSSFRIKAISGVSSLMISPKLQQSRGTGLKIRKKLQKTLTQSLLGWLLMTSKTLKIGLNKLLKVDSVWAQSRRLALKRIWETRKENRGIGKQGRLSSTLRYPIPTWVSQSLTT